MGGGQRGALRRAEFLGARFPLGALPRQPGNLPVDMEQQTETRNGKAPPEPTACESFMGALDSPVSGLRSGAVLSVILGARKSRLLVAQISCLAFAPLRWQAGYRQAGCRSARPRGKASARLPANGERASFHFVWRKREGGKHMY